MKDFPLKPKLVKVPVIKNRPNCNCNLCRLSRYKDKSAYYAYLVGEANALEFFIKILKEQGWKNYGLSDTTHEKNLAEYLYNLDMVKDLLIEMSSKTKVVLIDNNNKEIKYDERRSNKTKN